MLEIGNVQLFNLEEDQDIPLALMPAFVLMDAKQELVNITEELKTGLRIGQLDEEGNVQNPLFQVALTRPHWMPC